MRGVPPSMPLPGAEALVAADSAWGMAVSCRAFGTLRCQLAEDGLFLLPKLEGLGRQGAGRWCLASAVLSESLLQPCPGSAAWMLMLRSVLCC